MPDIQRSAIVPYTPTQMYTLVDHIAAYPEFLEWCKYSEILHRDEDEVRARLTLAGAGISKSFTTLNRLQKNKMIEIRLVDGPLKHLEGFWRFDEHENNACRVALDLEFELGGGFLDFAFGPIFHQMANSLVDTFCQRADQLYAH